MDVNLFNIRPGKVNVNVYIFLYVYYIMLYILRSEFEEGVRKAVHNAINFIECATMLKEKGNSNASVALAIQAQEELGKALLLLDEIENGKEKITQKRWEKKYTDHKAKLNRANLALQKAIGYKRFQWDGRRWRSIGEGDVAREFTDIDLKHKERCYYVDFDFDRRMWLDPLERDTLLIPETFISPVLIIKEFVEYMCNQKGIILE